LFEWSLSSQADCKAGSNIALNNGNASGGADACPTGAYPNAATGEIDRKEQSPLKPERNRF
jgi:hypothetical protein